jgi:hypothetical protein
MGYGHVAEFALLGVHQNDNLERRNTSDTVDIEVNSDFYTYPTPRLTS